MAERCFHTSLPTVKPPTARCRAKLIPIGVMIFPGGTIFDAQSEPPLQDILHRPDLKPWTHYEMDEVRVVSLGSDSAMICYSVQAERGKETKYEALISSVWRKAAGGTSWQMVLHQQTPVHVL